VECKGSGKDKKVVKVDKEERRSNIIIKGVKILKDVEKDWKKKQGMGLESNKGKDRS